jgi:tetratricopeptide (TPR) repeat protein
MKRFFALVASLFLGTSDGAEVANAVSFDARHGMSLLQENKFDEAAAYFEANLNGNAMAYYGLATAKFKRDTKNITPAKLSEIIDLYEKAIALAPDLSDAYLMCGMALNARGAFQLGVMNKERAELTPAGVDEARTTLARADGFLRKAIELNPGFSKIVTPELETIRHLVGSHEAMRSAL